MLVLSAITVLTTMGVEFAYNTTVYYNLAQNERNRLQAYYMARSAYNFMRLELKFDKMFRQVVQSQNLGQYLGGNAQLPLCQQFPLSTGLIRAVFIKGEVPGMGGGGGEGEAASAPEETAPAPPTEGGENVEEARKDISISQEQGAKEFLSFEGDFDGECVDEGTKVNLNGLAGLSQTPGQDGSPSAFDQYKQFLFRFMSQDKFKPLFESAGVRIPDVVTNIGDWIDANNEINELDGRVGGAEITLYQRALAPYQVKNGKLTTLLEAYLIDGVVDEWFDPMIDYFTIYGDGTVNVCAASKEVVEGLIRRYVDSNPNLPPLRLEDQEEMDRLTSAITEACGAGGTGTQLAQQVAQALDTAIGAIAGTTTAPPPAPGATTPPAAGAAPGTPAAGATTSGFASYISTEPRYFSLKLTGEVGDTMVRIKSVVDVKDPDPKKWKLLYWKVY